MRYFIIKKKKAKCIVNTAAASSLGKILFKLCQQENIDYIGLQYFQLISPLKLKIGGKAQSEI